MKDHSRINRLIKLTQEEITNMQVLFNGTIMSNKMFRLMLKENKDIDDRFEQLNDRLLKLNRLHWSK